MATHNVVYYILHYLATNRVCQDRTLYSTVDDYGGCRKFHRKLVDRRSFFDVALQWIT